MNKLRCCLFAAGLCLFPLGPSYVQDVLVISSPEEIVEWFESIGWWGEPNREQQLAVPYALMTSTGTNWQTSSSEIPVEMKKEIFFRALLPLIMHANKMVEDRRERLAGLKELLDNGESLSRDDIAWLARIADVLRIAELDDYPIDDLETSDLRHYVSEALYKMDVIPAGLALGQSAYESGYATSRFAAQGNALFGQWTFASDGLIPRNQRAELGDHRVAAFDWPFDSVRSYFNNLNGHPAYDEFRRLRADLRRKGEPLNSMILADGLVPYAEIGQEYVDILKSIMIVNGLLIADDAQFRDEPMSFIFTAEDEQDAARLREEIELMKQTGEFDLIINQMNLE